MTALAFAAGDAKRIATAFLPDSMLGNRYDYYYVQGKLRSDPLYPGALAALRGSDAPLLAAESQRLSAAAAENFSPGADLSSRLAPRVVVACP